MNVKIKLFSTILVIILITGFIFGTENVVTWKQGEQLAKKWIKQHGNKLIKIFVYVHDKKLGFKSIRQYPNKIFYLKFKGYNISINLGNTLNRPFTFKKFKDAFTSISFNVIPPFRLKKWKVSLTVPLSSYSNVKVMPSRRKGFVKLYFKGKFFSIHGQKLTRDCYPPMMDAGLPRKCYFSVRKNMKFEILIHAGVNLKR